MGGNERKAASSQKIKRSKTLNYDLETYWKDKKVECWNNARLDSICSLFDKNLGLGVLVFSIPSFYAIFLMVFFPHPWIPTFTDFSIYGMVLLYIFIHVASIAHFTWFKYTFFEFFTEFNKIRDSVRYPDNKLDDVPIIIMTERHFDNFFSYFNIEAIGGRRIITVLSVVLGSFMASMAHMFNMPHFSGPTLWLWTSNWVIVFSLVVFFAILGLKNVFLSIEISRYVKSPKNTNFKFELELNSLHPDRFGGLESIGEIAVETSLLVTLIALIFPWFIEMIRLLVGLLSGFLTILLWISLGFAILIFIIAFLVPTMNIYARAKKARDDKLRQTGIDYKRAYEEFKNVAILTQANKDGRDPMKIVMLSMIASLQMGEFKETENMKVFPFAKPTLIKLFSGFIVPIMTFLIEQIFFK